MGVAGLRLLVRLIVEGAADHIEVLSQRCLGQPYSWYGGRDQLRLMLSIRVDKVGTLRG